MSSKVSQCNQPPKGAHGPFSYARSQQLRISSKVPTGATIASCPRATPLFSSAGHINPSNAHHPGRPTAAQAMRAKRGGSVMAHSSNGSGNGGGNGRADSTSPFNLYPPEAEPLDDDITTLVASAGSVENVLALLRGEVLLWAQRAYDGNTFTEDCDDQIQQLVRVIEELKRTGQCIIRGKYLRPRA